MDLEKLEFAQGSRAAEGKAEAQCQPDGELVWGRDLQFVKL